MIHLLPATLDDIAALARIYVDTWREQYAGILPANYLARMSYGEYENKWATYLATPGTVAYLAQTDRGEIVGFAHGGAARDLELNYFAEIYLLYVKQKFQRQGIGHELVAAMAHTFIQSGLWSMAIWALRDNPSRGFYNAMGGELVAEKHINVGGENFVEVAYGWRDTRLLSQGNCAIVARRR